MLFRSSTASLRPRRGLVGGAARAPWSAAPHARIATACADDTVRLFREVVGDDGGVSYVREETVDEAHAGDVNCVRWHPRDGRVLASAGDDGVVRVWLFSPPDESLDVAMDDGGEPAAATGEGGGGGGGGGGPSECSIC